MLKLNQKGAAHVIVLAVGLIILIGFTALSVSQISQEKTGNSPKSKSNKALKPGETRVTGKVTFYEQGPTDEVIGEKPDSATVAIGSAKDFLQWEKAAKAKPIEGTDERPLTKDTKPAQIEINKTAVGELDVTLSKNRNILCLVYAQSISWSTNSNKSTDTYGIFDCKQFTKTGEVKADIGLMGFGSNSIKCGEDVCDEFTDLQVSY